jgi:hypothetical protein
MKVGERYIFKEVFTSNPGSKESYPCKIAKINYRSSILVHFEKDTLIGHDGDKLCPFCKNKTGHWFVSEEELKKIDLTFKELLD